jgi:hypothetical protein
MKNCKLIPFIYFVLLFTGCQNSQPDSIKGEEIHNEPSEITSDSNTGLNKKKPTIIPSVAFLTYREADFFSIEYPENFIASRDTMRAKNNPSKISFPEDEAYFRSPDGLVEFYIFSPQWGGDPESYLGVCKNEEVVRDETKTINKKYEKDIHNYVTLKAKDESYLRSWVSIQSDIESGNNLHHVFGFKYTNKEAYKKYREQYLKFKKSLHQFAD